jgi:hypothetical protein
MTEHTPWLVWLGKEELRLIKELGYDHPAVLDSQNRFRDAYNAVKSVRNAYNSPSSQEMVHD